MIAAFEHIKQVQYLLSRLFESGFTTVINIEKELGECGDQAAELGMINGSELLNSLAETLSKLRAGQADTGEAIRSYCNIVSYYQLMRNVLILENI